MLETTNLILITIVIITTIALIFSKQVYAGLLYLGKRNKSHAGIRIIKSQNYVDIETGEIFQKSSTIRGLRADAIAAFVKL
jgi:hypothetical protein